MVDACGRYDATGEAPRRFVQPRFVQPRFVQPGRPLLVGVDIGGTKTAVLVVKPLPADADAGT